MTVQMNATSGTNRERVLAALRSSSLPLDDDQLAVRAGISPRQTVNIICRQMRDAGVLDRVSGPDGKIVNILREVEDDEAVEQPDVTQTAVSAERPMSPSAVAEEGRAPGHSQEQRLAEVHLLAALSQYVGRPLNPTTIRLPSGVRVEIDGADADQTVLVECWAHIGKVKGAQRLKVLTDAFKLTWISDNIPGRPRLVLCMGDEEAAAPFRNRRAWFGQTLADHGIEVLVVPLPDEVRAAVLAAQRRQYR